MVACMARRLLGSAVFFIATAESVLPAQAADAELRSAVAAIFDVSWEKTADGLAAAQSHHARAKAIAPDDYRADYSLMLVQWRYLRFDDADRTLRTLATATPDDWYAAQARIYLTVLMKKHSAALADCDQLSKRIAAGAESLERADDRRAAAEFLGKMFGYWEGPAAKSISQNTVATVRRQIEDRLPTSLREAFVAGRDSVVERFTNLDAEKQKTLSEAKQAEQKAKELDLQRLQAERQSVGADKELLQRQADELQTGARNAIAQIDTALAPLDAEWARLNARAQIPRAEIARVDADISILLAQANATDDPNLKASLLQRVDFLSVQARRAEIELQALDAQAVQVNVRRSALYNQRGQVIARYEADAKRLGVEAVKLDRNEKRIDVQQKKAIKPATGISPQVQNLTTTAASITSYVEFPLEHERRRVLDSFDR